MLHYLAGFLFTVRQLIYYEKILSLTITTFLHIIYVVRMQIGLHSAIEHLKLCVWTAWRICSWVEKFKPLLIVILEWGGLAMSTQM